MANKERNTPMITKTQIMESLIGKPVVDAMVKTLYNQSNDFPDIHQLLFSVVQYFQAIKTTLLLLRFAKWYDPSSFHYIYIQYIQTYFLKYAENYVFITPSINSNKASLPIDFELE